VINCKATRATADNFGVFATFAIYFQIFLNLLEELATTSLTPWFLQN
jgi:hypothetical protein